MVKKKGNKFLNLCFCSYSGGEAHTQHIDEDFLPGYGPCLVEGCGCPKYIFRQRIEVEDKKKFSDKRGANK
jgi:hypothetical protein